MSEIINKNLTNKLLTIVQEYYWNRDEVDVSYKQGRIRINMESASLDNELYDVSESNEVLISNVYAELKSNGEYKVLTTNKFINAVELGVGMHLLCCDFYPCVLDLKQIRDKSFPELTLYAQHKFVHFCYVIPPFKKI